MTPKKLRGTTSHEATPSGAASKKQARGPLSRDQSLAVRADVLGLDLVDNALFAGLRERILVLIQILLGQLVDQFVGTFLGDFADPAAHFQVCLLYTSPSPRDGLLSRMPSSA